MIGWPSGTGVGRVVTVAGVTLGGAGGGWLAATTADLKAKMIIGVIAIAGALAANALARMAESLCKRLPQIIKERGAAKKGVIAAQSEAEALIIRAEAQTDLLRAGLNPDLIDQATELLRWASINADLPPDRRLSDEILAKLLASRTKSSKGHPGDDQGHDGPRGIVRPIR